MAYARTHVSGVRISVSANLVEKCRIKIHDIGHSSRILHCLAVVEDAMNLCNSSAHTQWQHFEVTHSPNRISRPKS